MRCGAPAAATLQTRAPASEAAASETQSRPDSRAVEGDHRLWIVQGRELSVLGIPQLERAKGSWCESRSLQQRARSSRQSAPPLCADARRQVGGAATVQPWPGAGTTAPALPWQRRSSCTQQLSTQDGPGLMSTSHSPSNPIPHDRLQGTCVPVHARVRMLVCVVRASAPSPAGMSGRAAGSGQTLSGPRRSGGRTPVQGRGP